MEICTQQMSLSFLQKCAKEINNEDMVLPPINYYAGWYAEWVNDYLSPSLQNISLAKTKYQQMIKIRMEILTCVEKYLSAKYYMKNDLSKEDMVIVKTHLFGDESYDDVAQLKSNEYNYFIPTAFVLRDLSVMFDDFNDNDYFNLYVDRYSDYIKNYYKGIAVKHKSEENSIDFMLSEMLSKVLDEAIADIKTNVLTGGNYDYDREKIERENEKIEREKEEEEKRKIERQPKKQKFIAEYQVNELGRYILQRYERAKKGDIFKPLDNKVVDLRNVLLLDTGLMLIALSECLENEEVCVIALKKIIARIGNNINENDIDIDIQMLVLGIYKEKIEKQWLADVCLVATSYIFEIDYGSLNEKEKFEFFQFAAKHIDTVYEVFRTTKEVFGWENE